MIGTDRAECCQNDCPEAEELQQMIAVAAYFRAQRRGFAPGCEIDDWLAAQAELEGQART